MDPQDAPYGLHILSRRTRCEAYIEMDHLTQLSVCKAEEKRKSDSRDKSVVIFLRSFQLVQSELRCMANLKSAKNLHIPASLHHFSFQEFALAG
jgi:hypothetical protein